MGIRGRKRLKLGKNDENRKLVKRNYYIDEGFGKALIILSALTGKELSLLVNEAIHDLLHKYQPETDIDLFHLKNIIQDE